MSAFEIKTIRDASDTLDLRYGIWQPTGAAATPKKRWVVFANGRTEWIEKYDYLPADLRLPPDCGFLTWDHRGQGASGGARSYVDSYDSYAQDAGRIVHEVVGDAPYVVLAHSMGGLISLYATLKGHLRPQALALSSPLLGLPDEPFPEFIARPIAGFLSAVMCGTVISGAGSFTKRPFATNRLTHHAGRYERMQATPYPVPGATFGWVAKTFAALSYVYDSTALRSLTAPTLVMGGSKESVVKAEAFRLWVQQASKHAQAEIQLRIVQGAKHELFSELPEYYDQAVATAREWFREFLR